MTAPRTVGIIGGMGPEATCTFFERIIRRTIFGSKGNLSFSGKTMTNMDGDSTSGDAQGKEVQEIIAKQIMQDVDAGTYTVVIRGLCDVAGNDGPGGDAGVITGWTIYLE